MGISTDTLARLAKHSSLSFTAEEYSTLAQNIDRQLEFIQEIDKVDAAQVSLQETPIDAKRDLREDVVVPSLTLSQALKNAPMESDGAYLVPATVE